MQFMFVLIVFAIVLPLQLIAIGKREGKIDERIRSIGGELIGCEKTGFMGDKGPFHIVGKGRTIYKVEYRINGEIQIGWVRFGGILGPDWRL